jgi:tetratricopeptide (TPR) repeat protein
MLILATVSIAAAQTPKLPPDFAARLASLEQARQAHPNDIQILDALSGSYAMAAEYRKASAVLQQMRTLNPGDPSIGLRLARNHAWAGDTRRAIAEYSAYLRAAPHDRQATVELIRLRRYRGDYFQAEELCNRLLSTRPDDAEVLALKAEVLHWAGDRRFLARRTADQAAALEPAYPDAKVARVYASLDLGENRRASNEFAALRGLIDRRGGVPAESSYGDAYKLLEGIFARSIGFAIKPGFSVYINRATSSWTSEASEAPGIIVFTSHDVHQPVAGLITIPTAYTTPSGGGVWSRASRLTTRSSSIWPGMRPPRRKEATSPPGVTTPACKMFGPAHRFG